MAHMIINGKQIELEGEKNVLGVIRKAGIDIPTLCYYPDLAPYGACRMCLVENERGGMIAACSEVPYDGMVVKTDTAKLKKHRKLMLELLLGSHCRDCLTCRRSEKCQLQELAIRMGVDTIRFANDKEPHLIDDTDHILEFDRVKCVLCGNCIRVCDELQNVGAVNFAKRGSEMYVTTAFDKPMSETNCTGCGQCSVSCPTGAITLKDESDKLWQAIEDDGKRTVALVDPSIAATVGAEFGLPAGGDALGKLVGALRRIGFDEVYDISLTAGVVRAAEIAAFLERFDEQGKLPWFTSMCPAWEQYANDRHPGFQAYISANTTPVRAMSAKLRKIAASAAGGSGAADNADTAGNADTVGNLFIAAIGPCTAAKLELAAGRGGLATDMILTARELVQIIKGSGLSLSKLAPEAPDSIAGVFGGADDAIDDAIAGDAINDDAIDRARLIDDARVINALSLSEAVMRAKEDRDVRAVTVYGLANAEEIIRQVKSGDVRYDFIEVLACPRGCETGAGHPLASVRQRLQSEI